MPEIPSNSGAKPEGHLINLLTQTRDHHPNFMLLLGAGASVTSGVNTANAMINEWRKQYAKIHGPEDADAKRYKNAPEEYAFLFEALFDQPSQRRDYIETCLTNASPSWGYIYLVNLLSCGVFNTIFTTNFDDLINEACFAYSSGVRPVVCAHDSSIENVRVFSNRPKIIKLHGDFLFDNLKNTVRETAALENNMRHRFEQYSSDYGLIVIGYSGSDRSVLEPIEAILRSPNGFPNGVYWCIRKGSQCSPAVEQLSRHPGFHLIEISGFDQFFAELHGSLDLDLPPELVDPYGALAKKLDSLMQSIGLPSSADSHPVIERDVQRIAEQTISVAIGDKIQTDRLPVSDAQSAKLTSVSQPVPVPFEFLANFFLRRGEVKRAQVCLAAALDRKPSATLLEFSFTSLRMEWDPEFSAYVMDFVRKSPLTFEDGVLSPNDMSLELIHAGQFDLALELLELEEVLPKNNPDYVLLNKSQLQLHRGEELTREMRQHAVSILELEQCDAVLRMGAAIVLQEWSTAETHLKAVVADQRVLAALLPTWPIIKLLIPYISDSKLREWIVNTQREFLGPKLGQYNISKSLATLVVALNGEQDDKSATKKLL